jgi:hypothetical protein
MHKYKTPETLSAHTPAATRSEMGKKSMYKVTAYIAVGMINLGVVMLADFLSFSSRRALEK